jgi:putative transposase
MPRTARTAIGGIVYHVLNRGNGRARIFHKPSDFDAFVKILIEGQKHASTELLAFCLMGNHWHLITRPRRDGDLAKLLSWITNTHVKRYRAHRQGTSGHLYQGRFKSFPVEEDDHLLTVLRYVEANPLRARLVRRAQDWRWSSLGCGREIREALLSDWPIDRPGDWTATVNRSPREREMQAVRTSIERGRPFGSESWVGKMVNAMGLSLTLRPRGRPRKARKVGTRTAERGRGS